jgi:hypothetical protein
MSILGNMGRNLISARQRQADNIVYSTLLGLDDNTIRAAGYTRDELKRKVNGAFYL